MRVMAAAVHQTVVFGFIGHVAKLLKLQRIGIEAQADGFAGLCAMDDGDGDVVLRTEHVDAVALSCSRTRRLVRFSKWDGSGWRWRSSKKARISPSYAWASFKKFMAFTLSCNVRGEEKTLGRCPKPPAET